MKNYWLRKREYEEEQKLKEEASVNYAKAWNGWINDGVQIEGVIEDCSIIDVGISSEVMSPKELQELYSEEIVIHGDVDLKGVTITGNLTIMGDATITDCCITGA
jgi:hypothetical protein